MLTPQPAPAPVMPPPFIDESIADTEPEMTDEEFTELEARIYYSSHDDREDWN